MTIAMIQIVLFFISIAKISYFLKRRTEFVNYFGPISQI